MEQNEKKPKPTTHVALSPAKSGIAPQSSHLDLGIQKKFQKSPNGGLEPTITHWTEVSSRADDGHEGKDASSNLSEKKKKQKVEISKCGKSHVNVMYQYQLKYRFNQKYD